MTHRVHDRARFCKEGTQWGLAGTVKKVNLRALSRIKVRLPMCVVGCMVREWEAVHTLNLPKLLGTRDLRDHS